MRSRGGASESRHAEPIRGSGVGDLYRLHATAERDEIEFHVGWIPGEIPCPDPTEEFDPPFMECLYQVGQEAFENGTLWRDRPPFFATPAAVENSG